MMVSWLPSCKLTNRWLENPPNFDGIYQERWGFSWVKMLVSGSVPVFFLVVFFWRTFFLLANLR